MHKICIVRILKNMQFTRCNCLYRNILICIYNFHIFFYFRWIVGSGAHAGVYPRGPEFREEIINKLRNVDGLLVWDRKDIPEEYHYKNSKNTPPILVLAKPQNIILLSPPEFQKPDGGRCSGNGRSPLKRQSHYRSVHRVMDQMRKGLAGYDPDEEDMRGIFMAKGPGKICLQECYLNFLFECF